MISPRLVLLGGPYSGKTHFAGQLYGRLSRRPESLRLRQDDGIPPDLSAFQEVLEALEAGHTAEHTSAGTWAEVTLPIQDATGRPFDLTWPDYGGEQLTAVVADRSVTPKWQERLAAANGWVVLIRLGSETTYPEAMRDLAATHLSESASEARVTGRRQSWEANATWVELLQILLHVSGHSTSCKARAPRLAVLLSCYDELARGSESPREVLAQKLPLFAAFLNSSWLEGQVSVWGLSALGRKLDPKTPDDEFVDLGPEHHGWVVPPDGGPPDSDLTLPIAWLLEAS